MQEVKVQTSNYAAEHGGSAVQDQRHDEVAHDFTDRFYDYLRNYNFQANDRSNSINGVKRPLSKYNYPGGNVGGPVIFPGTNFNKNRDKLFFFFGFEYYYQRVDEGSLFNATLLWSSARATSAAPTSIFPPAAAWRTSTRRKPASLQKQPWRGPA